MEMKKQGQTVIINFPYTDLSRGKPRPALLISKVPGKFDDWLICMISTKLEKVIKTFDEIINKSSVDFDLSGLLSDSVIRISKLAVVSEDILIGTIGEISQKRLLRIKENLCRWIRS